MSLTILFVYRLEPLELALCHIDREFVLGSEGPDIHRRSEDSSG